MKTKTLSLLLLFLVGTFVLSAKEKTEKFLVNGKCEMCEKRIEKAAKSQWDEVNKKRAEEIVIESGTVDIESIMKSGQKKQSEKGVYRKIIEISKNWSN